MVDADAVAEDFREFAAVGGAEIGVVEGAGDGGAGVLGEVDEVNRGAALFVELGDFFLELSGGIFELERARGKVSSGICQAAPREWSE